MRGKIARMTAPLGYPVETTHERATKKLEPGFFSASAESEHVADLANIKQRSPPMMDLASERSSVRVIVVANEKGGSGKSTIAFNLAIALMKSGLSVASIDLDTRQRSFTHFIDNRLAWSGVTGTKLPTPEHCCFGEDTPQPEAADEDAARAELVRVIDDLASRHQYIVIDTAGHNHFLSRFAHCMADTLITPMNDSFVDLDVLATLDPGTTAITGVSHFGQAVEQARQQRAERGKPPMDWIVMRNRLSVLSTRNKRDVGAALAELSRMLDFRTIEGLTERVIFREFYPKGLTALDDLKQATLGTRPTMSHVAAQMEIQGLLTALMVGTATRIGNGDAPLAHAAA